MPTTRLHLLVIAFSVVLLGVSQPKAGQPEVAVSQRDGQNRVVVLRPAASRMHLSDRVRLVLHVEAQNERGERSPVQRTAITTLPTLGSLQIKIAAPGGKEQSLAIDTKKKPQGLPETTFAPTLALELHEDGVQFDYWPLYAQQPMNFSWQDGAKFSSQASGVYKVSVSGSLHEGENTTKFAVGPISIERGAMGLPTADELIAKARRHAAEDANAPELKQKSKVNAKPWVIEDDRGRHTVLLLGSSRGWSQQRYYVTFDPQGEHIATAQRSVGTCIAEGTPIDTPSGPVAIQRLRVGDRIWGFNHQEKQRTLVNILAMRSHVAPGTLRVGQLQLTGEHLVYANEAYVPASDLQPNDKLQLASGMRRRVGAIEPVAGPIAVYDITVDGVHNYFAGGILVHNKDREYWPHVDDAYYVFWPTEKYLPEPVKKAE